MSYALQRYLVAMDDTIYRMANTAFDPMLRDRARCRSPELAGQRVRTAEAVVDLAGRNLPPWFPHRSAFSRSTMRGA